MKRRRAIIASSGGSALRAAVDLLRAVGRAPQLLVVVDRDCELFRWALGAGHETHLVRYEAAETFSQDVFSILRDGECSDALLFYTRRIAAPLIDEIAVSNIHPSLLPAYPGLHGVEDAIANSAGVLGATLHQVDADLDSGPIIAQVACALPRGTMLSRAQRLSFLQKVWLTLLWFEGPVATIAPQMAPAVVASGATLANAALVEAFAQWQAQAEGV